MLGHCRLVMCSKIEPTPSLCANTSWLVREFRNGKKEMIVQCGFESSEESFSCFLRCNALYGESYPGWQCTNPSLKHTSANCSCLLW